MNNVIDLYYWPTPNGWKISIALEEMKLPYRTHAVDINKGEQFDKNFLSISPNNRIPAIVDKDGPDGRPIYLFESGAILYYLAKKTSSFMGNSEREQQETIKWLMWQMGGLGPMAGQAHHFLRYAPSMDPPQKLPYAQDRYRSEVARLYRVLNNNLADRLFVAGNFFSIADMAIWPWASLWERQEQHIDSFPNVQRWLAECQSRAGVQNGRNLLKEKRTTIEKNKEAQHFLFGKAGNR